VNYSQDFLSRVLKQALSRGGDYCDVFIEDRDDTALTFDSGKIKSITTGKTAGVGIRVIYGKSFVYLYSSDPSEKTILELAEATAQSVKWDHTGNLGDFRGSSGRGLVIPKVSPGSVDLARKVEYVQRANQAARDHSSKIQEVMVRYMDHDQRVSIATSDGNFVNDRRVRTRFVVQTIAGRGDEKETGFYGPGRSMGFEFFDEFSPEAVAEESARIALVRLDSDYAPQGKLPVVIDNEFGGVIFHEACGHALEATAVGNDASVFCGKFGKQIASPVVSAVDDGTIPSSWGSADFDDEGNPTQKNQLIKDGVLTSYMIDKLGSIKMGMDSTASSRRESYKFAPTSRMTNTFIEPGEDSFEDMISSIEHGLYCKKLGGGSVNPPTTDFNFAVQEGYLIKNGKIDKPVKGASLIGKGNEILMNIEMIADNLDINGTGMCGSLSGSIPANVGQPAIKVGGLVVGGR
jgi:TldD protein